LTTAIGGVDVCLKNPVDDDLSGAHFGAGPQTIQGAAALSFVRQRHGLPRGDLDREVRQQYFLSTELRRVASTGVLLNPGRLNRLLTAVSGALETDPGLDLLKFATDFKNVGAGQVRFATIPTTGTPTIHDANGNAVSIVAVDVAALPAFIAQVVGAPSDYTSADAAAPSETSVRVVNGTGTAGLAATAARQLHDLGFPIAGTANASSATTLTTVTYPAGMESEAKAVAQKVPGVTVVPSSGASQVTLTLGTDGLRVATGQAATGSGGSGTSSAAPSSAAPAKAPATSFDATSCIN
jgi:hypothetical protein